MSVEPVAAHPLVSCADAIEAALKEVAGVDPVFLATGDKADVLVRLHVLEGRLTGLRLRVMAGADELAADHSVATWLAAETRTEPRTHAGDLALARVLERRWHRLSGGVAEGSVNLPQARVIADALDDLPKAEVDPETLARAEEALVQYAATYGPGQLRRLGRRILEVTAPDTCDEQEGRALEREERRAAALANWSATSRSARPKHVGWPAAPTSLPWCSGAGARCSTSVGADGSSPPLNARPWPSATVAVAPRAAPSPHRGARPITRLDRRRPAVARTSPTASCCARGTTTARPRPSFRGEASARRRLPVPDGSGRVICPGHCQPRWLVRRAQAGPITASGSSPSDLRTVRAALRPGRPETEPPGCVVAPVTKSRGMSVS
jgi:Domain of unknown function (DUF222)